MYKAYILALILYTCLISVNIHAKPHADFKSQTTVIDISKETVQAKIDTVNNRKGIDEAVKSRILSSYQSAQDNLNNIENYKTRSHDFNIAIKQSPDLLKNYQNELNQIVTNLAKQKPEDLTKLSTEELEQKEISIKGKISTLDEQLKKLENEINLQEARPARIREEITTAKQDLETNQAKTTQAVNKTLSKLETDANLIYLKTLIDARSAELKMLDIEALSNPERVELLKAQFKVLDMQKNELTPIITNLSDLMTARREKDTQNIQNALNQAEKELAGKHPLIQALTRENIQITRDLQGISLKIENYTAQKSKIDNASTEITAEYKDADKKISLAAISPELGKILREQRRNLEVQTQANLQHETIQNETALASLNQYKTEESLKKLSDLDSYHKQLMSIQVDQSIPAVDRFLIQTEVRTLLNNQKDLLNKLAVDDSSLLRILGDFDFAQQQMLTLASKFTNYLDENLLWVKSSDPVGLDTLLNIFYSIQWLVSPRNWLILITDIGHIANEKPFLFILGIAGILALRFSKNWAQTQLLLSKAIQKQKHIEHFSYTLQTLLYSFLLVIPVPLICSYFGWLINQDIHIDDFSRALGMGFKNAAITSLFLNYFYLLFAVNGVAHKHFQWQKINCQLLYKELKWIRYIAISTSFLISCTAASSHTQYGDNLGRLAFIISMVAMSIFWGRLLNPKTGLFRKELRQNKYQWINQLRFIWYPAIYFIPMTLIAFAISGYYLSALQLQGQIIQSMRLIFVAIILHQLVVRWLTLINHQLAILNAEEQRKSTANHEKPASAASEDPVLPRTETLIDIPKINAQTTRLLNVFIGLGLVIGFWVIWKNLLPAFSFLDNIILWQHLVIKEDQKIYEPITLSHLMIAGLYLFIAIVSVRNFSGVMEILIFRRIAIEAGTRYAFNQLANYSLITIGFITISNELGGSWSQVQWLVAALSVGLGFGLQEIFANLVSGIILLFERPIRVSDTVTIGSITGKVSRIQMRATTLIDWDQKEHVVPNKTFITSQLVNWTLSDTITRLELFVNVAYGSDLELAHQVMFDCVLAIPEILKEPAPCVLIVGFGDSSVNFSIRIFVDEMANRLPVTHNLYINIEKALREHNIEMPFPQRDIHIKSLPM